MSQHHHPAVNDLAALRSLLDRRTPVCAIEWQGQAAWAKRRSSLRSHERLLLALSPLLRRWLAPGEAFEPTRYDPGLPLEAQRLRVLAEKGRVVPQLLAVEHDLFVMSNVGCTLPQLLDAESNGKVRSNLLQQAAHDLADWHRAGFWHGGAQIRNVVRTADGRYGRIDFETNLDRHLPLSVLQAFDAALFFTSIARTRDSSALPMIADAYLDSAPEAAKRALRRGLPLLRGLARSRLLKWLAPKEAERLRAVAALRLG